MNGKPKIGHRIRRNLDFSRLKELIMNASKRRPKSFNLPQN